MQAQDPINKVIVVKNSPKEFQLFIWVHDIGTEPAYKKIEFDKDLFTEKELEFLDSMNPTMEMGRYYWDMLDSPDDEHQRMGKELCQMQLKDILSKWVK